MTNTYDTTALPVGTSDPRVLYNNASNMDEALHSLTAFWQDRFGKARKTWSGFEADVLAFFQNNGYETPVNYAAGLSMTRYGQTVVYLGELYAPLVAAIPFTTTNWATDSAKFKAIGDASVRAALAASDGSKKVGYKARTVDARLAERASLLDQAGVIPNSNTADNLTQINAAIAASQDGKVMLGPDIYRASAKPTNSRGVEFEGKGGIAIPALGGLRQISKYADKHKYAIGHEYLGKVYKRLEIDGQLTIHLHGDSTMAGGNGESAAFSTASIIRTILANKGLSNVNVINYAVGGTRFNDVAAQLHIDATAGNSTDLLIIKDGINDMGTGSPTRIDDMTTALRTLLSGIRNGTNGSLDKLSIILVGPNATNDIPNGRDEKAYEQLRGIFVQAARDYQCCFIDVYAYLNDCWGMANFTMDSPFPANPTIAIHPLNVMQTWLWGFILDYAFGQSETRIYAKNNFQNSGASAGVIPFATPLTSFNYGLSIYRCTDGPVSGQLVTFRHTDGGGWQILFGFGSTSKKVERTWNIAGAAWTASSGVITDATLLNSWVNFGSTRRNAGYYKGSDGRGYACGTIKSGTITAGTLLFTVPAEFRPVADHVSLNRGAGGGIGIGINAAGNVFLQSAGDATETCLDNLSWPIG
jgi:lysophospholipase L1-like esterase